METMHPAGRRRLPPVPRTAVDPNGTTRTTTGTAVPPPSAVSGAPDGSETDRFTLPPATGEQESHRPPAPEPNIVPEPNIAQETAGAPAVQPISPEPDDAQRFVADLRAAAADFAEAAGATSAVVLEAVPPARHRRSRCRVVLRYPDESEADLTFLGPAGAPPRSPSRHGFDRQIRRWLGAGQPTDGDWLVPDPEARDGVAVDVSAWHSAG